jgi:hypothetical protein
VFVEAEFSVYGIYSHFRNYVLAAIEIIILCLSLDSESYFQCIFYKLKNNVGFEVLIAVFIKFSAFLNITPCSLLKSIDISRGSSRLHLQRRKISQGRN